MDQAKEQRKKRFRDILNTHIEVDQIHLDPAPDGTTPDKELVFVAMFRDPQSVTYGLDAEQNEFLDEWVAEKISDRIVNVPPLYNQIRRQIPKGPYKAKVLTHNQTNSMMRKFRYIVKPSKEKVLP